MDPVKENCDHYPVLVAYKIIIFFFLADERLCSALVLLRYGQVIRFPFYVYLGRRVLVLSSGWLASYSGSVGGACVNNHSMGVPYSGGFQGKIGSVFHYFSLGGLPLWGSKTGSKHPKTGLI